MAFVFLPSRLRLAACGSRSRRHGGPPCLLFLGARDRFEHQLFRTLHIEPLHDRDPFALFQILVVLEEMRDLLAHHRWQIAVAAHVLVKRRPRVDRHRDDFFVLARLVFH